MNLPDPGIIEVSSFRIDDAGGIPLVAAEALLCGGERARASAFRFPVHRDRYIRGRAALRLLLGKVLGREPDEIVFSLEKNGKPYLADGAIHFNLSHSEDFAVLALSRLPTIGIDVECYDRDVKIDALSRRCFRDAELDHFRTLDADRRKRLFFALWTAKEARMKATGEGFQLEPKMIEIGFERGKPFRYLRPETPEAFFAEVFISDAVVCSVAALARFEIVSRAISAAEWETLFTT